MPHYHAIDEAVIDAPPSVVFRALLDECTGVTHWWQPHVVVTPEGDLPFDQVGATARSVVHSGLTARFLWRIIAIECDRLISIEYAEGDLVGIGTLTLEPEGERTRLRYTWDVRTSGWKSAIAAPILGMGRRHSWLMERGFEGLNEYVTSQRPR